MGQHYYEIFLFHSLSCRTPFWIRGNGTLPGGPVGLFLTKTSSWRSLNCNSNNTALSTLAGSLQVIDNLGIIEIDRDWTPAWNASFSEFGGTAQPALPTRTPGL